MIQRIILAFLSVSVFSCASATHWTAHISIEADDTVRVQEAAGVIRERLAAVGEVSVFEELGAGRYLFEFTAKLEAPVVENLLTQRGELDFCQVVQWEELPLLLELARSLVDCDPEDPEAARFKELFYPVFPGYGDPHLGMVAAGNIEALMEVLETDVIRSLVPRDCRFAAGYFPTENYYDVYLIRKTPGDGGWTGSIADAWANKTPGSVHSEIAIVFDRKGALRWAALTRESVGRNLAVLMDGRVMSAPRVAAQITDGRAALTGQFSEDEMRVYAAMLRGDAVDAAVTVDKLSRK